MSMAWNSAWTPAALAWRRISVLAAFATSGLASCFTCWKALRKLAAVVVLVAIPIVDSGLAIPIFGSELELFADFELSLFFSWYPTFPDAHTRTTLSFGAGSVDGSVMDELTSCCAEGVDIADGEEPRSDETSSSG
jgi:hypothetical protein